MYAEKIKKFVDQCTVCTWFVDKKTAEPISYHNVPSECWDTVAVDLFGPMPTSKHVVVVQDLTSRFPAAKLVSSTKADKLLPALEEIDDTLSIGNRVLVRNFNRHSKFEPLFKEEPCVIIEINDIGNKIAVERNGSDDLKPYYGKEEKH